MNHLNALSTCAEYDAFCLKSSDDGHLSKGSKITAEEFTKMTGQKTGSKFGIFVTAFFILGARPCPLQRTNWTEVTFIGVPPVLCINMI
jgi:hypothetical protein